MRIGFGYDSHRLVAGRPFILGGVTVPHELGLQGHSDADVLVHALCDAILGALAAGDIGRHFPDTDEAYRGVSSLRLLEKVRILAEERGYRVHNADATVVLENPKIAAYAHEMSVNIAGALKVTPDCVSVKAKTNEGMGFTGRREGVAAYAVVTVQKRGDE